MKGITSSQAIGVLFVMMLGVSGASAFESWNAADEFDLDFNPAALYPWSYGGGTGTQFQLAEIKYSAYGLAGWNRYSVGYLYPDIRKNVSGGTLTIDDVGQDGLVPKDAVTFAPNFASPETGTIRWTAPFTGQFRVDCDFTGVYEYTGTSYPHGTNVDVFVFVQGVQEFSDNILNHGTTGFQKTYSLAEGSTVDFAVGYGPNETGDWDRVILDATITEVPEPATLSLLALGGLAVLRRRRAER